MSSIFSAVINLNKVYRILAHSPYRSLCNHMLETKLKGCRYWQPLDHSPRN